MLAKFFSRVASMQTQSSLISYKTAKVNSLDSYQDLAETGYKKNVIVYRCVHLISRSISSVNWILKKANATESDEFVYKHNMLDLIEKPNAMQCNNKCNKMRSISVLWWLFSRKIKKE
ncbi:hypothetical protein FACS1894113_2510 [Alphaproteobacteria bacterium]|nr:hypothetical protein FACS1894113_2510 [Alphaproteobacteria bacterium]